MTRLERIEELAQVLGAAEAALHRAYLISRDLGYADLTAELASLIAVLRDEEGVEDSGVTP
jgi:Asp/Glu/hydantoin racemase